MVRYLCPSDWVSQLTRYLYSAVTGFTSPVATDIQVPHRLEYHLITVIRHDIHTLATGISPALLRVTVPLSPSIINGHSPSIIVNGHFWSWFTGSVKFLFAVFAVKMGHYFVTLKFYLIVDLHGPRWKHCITSWFIFIKNVIQFFKLFLFDGCFNVKKRFL